MKLDAFIVALERRYAPDQPRVAAGNSDGGQWTLGSVASGARVSRLPSVLDLAAATSDFRYACQALRIDPKRASDLLHAIKSREGLGGADNCIFDTETADVLRQGEKIGNLREPP